LVIPVKPGVDDYDITGLHFDLRHDVLGLYDIPVRTDVGDINDNPLVHELLERQ